MKKFAMVLVFLSVNLLAFPPLRYDFIDGLLSDNGHISEVKAKAFKDYYFYFEDITLTGVVARFSNDSEGGVSHSLWFFPDRNISLPFLYVTLDYDYLVKSGAIYDEKRDSWDISKVRFEELNFGVELDTSKVSLSKGLDSIIFGEAGVRAEITIRDYNFFGEGEAGHWASASLVAMKPLSKVSVKYYTREKYSSDYFAIAYASKDDFVNIRDKPSGKIIGKITKDEMRDGGLLVAISGDSAYYCLEDKDCSGESQWVEAFYLSPSAKDGSQAIRGYIHNSQIKVKGE